MTLYRLLQNWGGCSGRGVRLLKGYLEFAAGGGTQRLPPDELAGEVGLNPFEADIKDALQAKGIHVRPQFGASRYRIDLVAMHPKKSGMPVLAIECDGAAYHSSATARDRDRLRQEHLQRLGWRFHRIWSTDWFYNREQEIERAVAAYGDAVRRADLAATGTTAADPERAGRKPVVPKLQPPTMRERSPRPLVRARTDIDQYRESELRSIAERVVSDGLLRTDDEVIREIFAALPFQRMGSRIRQRLERVAAFVRLRQGRGEKA